MDKPLLQQQLECAFPELNENDFAYHHTDLYVRCTPQVEAWLEEYYDFSCNITTFDVPLKGELANLGVVERWLDIPFAGPWPEL